MSDLTRGFTPAARSAARQQVPLSQLMGRIGLTTETGTYNIDRYPRYYDAWKKQQQAHWIGEEVPLGEDVKDWANKLDDAERNFLTHIFRFFTQSDVEVADNYFKRFIPIFKPLEIQMMMAAFTNMETVHIDAYALLVKTLGMPQTVFDAFKDYKSMRDKHDYMQTFGVNTDADVSRTLAMFAAFTEGLALFGSFSMLMEYPRFNKMKGMGQIVTYSVRDETIHCDNGIALFHDWNRETGCLTSAVKDDIIDVGTNMVRLEHAFIDQAYEMGGRKGSEPEKFKRYIDFLADWRLYQLGLPTKFYNGRKDVFSSKSTTPAHPMPWLNAILNGVEFGNFFETRTTAYSKGSTEGSWSEVFAFFDSSKTPAKDLGHLSIRIYSKTDCPFCVKAKALALQKGVRYEEVDLSDDQERQQFYKDRQFVPGVNATVPKIYALNDKGEEVRLIGGFSHLEHELSGE